MIIMETIMINTEHDNRNNTDKDNYYYNLHAENIGSDKVTQNNQNNDD